MKPSSRRENDTIELRRHGEGAVRHAEKRRIGTCRFADRVARVSLDAYLHTVPKSFRDSQKQTCVATIVAHFRSKDEKLGYLQVMALGVGTKFLSETKLRQEERLIGTTSSGSSTGKEQPLNYGMRVRDCHAEVLARRAFRRQLCLEIQQDLHGTDCGGSRPLKRILVRVGASNGGDSPIRYRLMPHVTLHTYSSSAPCGNATLKKFTKMEKERFNHELGPDEWPSARHEPIPAHSLRLGQFALLMKKGNSGATTESSCPATNTTAVPEKEMTWPANQSDGWCPPGTSIVWFQKGSLHTCSDKICRWNCLGLQGSLLSVLLDSPLYMSTLTVGRKLTACICRRAVCCRAWVQPATTSTSNNSSTFYQLHHPAIMGTGIYMDDSGVIDMSDSKAFGRDVRFTSSLCWVWCPLMDEAECIDGSTGFVHSYDGALNERSAVGGTTSVVSTAALFALFISIIKSIPQLEHHLDSLQEDVMCLTLAALRDFKRSACPEYEIAKDELLTKHRIFRQWRRRENNRKEMMHEPGKDSNSSTNN